MVWGVGWSRDQGACLLLHRFCRRRDGEPSCGPPMEEVYDQWVSATELGGTMTWQWPLQLRLWVKVFVWFCVHLFVKGRGRDMQCPCVPVPRYSKSFLAEDGDGAPSEASDRSDEHTLELHQEWFQYQSRHEIWGGESKDFPERHCHV